MSRLTSLSRLAQNNAGRCLLKLHPANPGLRSDMYFVTEPSGQTLTSTVKYFHGRLERLMNHRSMPIQDSGFSQSTT